MVIWRKQLTHWKSPWCWERLEAEREDGLRGWDGWMASLMQCTWTWANFGRWWGTERPGLLQSMGSQRVRHDWATEQQQQQAMEKVTMLSNGKGEYFKYILLNNWNIHIKIWILATALSYIKNNFRWNWDLNLKAKQ